MISQASGSHVLPAFRDEEAQLPQQAPERIDPPDAIGQPAGAQPVQRRDHLLGHRLDRDGPDLFVAKSLQEPVDIRSIGLVPHHVRPHVLRWKQDDDVTQLLDPSSPVVSRAAGFHHDRRLR
jgi:hypothetical protein